MKIVQVFLVAVLVVVVVVESDAIIPLESSNVAAAFAPVRIARAKRVKQQHQLPAVTTFPPARTPLQRNSTTLTTTQHRFDRTASQIRQIDQPCVLTIHNVRYNVTAWGTYARVQ